MIQTSPGQFSFSRPRQTRYNLPDSLSAAAAGSAGRQLKPDL